MHYCQTGNFPKNSVGRGLLPPPQPWLTMTIPQAGGFNLLCCSWSPAEKTQSSRPHCQGMGQANISCLQKYNFFFFFNLCERTMRFERSGSVLHSQQQTRRCPLYWNVNKPGLIHSVTSLLILSSAAQAWSHLNSAICYFRAATFRPTKDAAR